MIQLATQLAVFIENKPGTLKRLCQALTDGGVNIDAISTSDTVDHSVVRLIVSDTRRALDLFQAHGALVVESEVLLIEAPNKPGALCDIARKLADAAVNIEYLYSAASAGTKKGLIVLRSSNPRKALKVLNS